MNFYDYLNHQCGEEKRAFIMHFTARSGKTRFAQKVCETRSDAFRLDLLAYFHHQADLPPIQQCGFEQLRQIMLGLDIPQAVILVDNGDFLFNTWNQEEKDAFLNWLRRGLRSPANTDKTFVFILQSDDWFTTQTIGENVHGEDRILAMSQFEAL